MTQNIQSTNIRHINTKTDILDNYGKDAFINFLSENQFEIQSTKIIGDTEKKNTPEYLSGIWESVLNRLLKDTSINLWQMIRNYESQTKKSVKWNDIKKKLYEFAIREYAEWKEENIEAIMFGVWMIFVDSLDWDATESIVHLTQGRAIDIINSQWEWGNQMNKIL